MLLRNVKGGVISEDSGNRFSVVSFPPERKSDLHKAYVAIGLFRVLSLLSLLLVENNGLSDLMVRVG